MSSAKKYAFHYSRDYNLDAPRVALAKAHWPAWEITYEKDAEHYRSFLCSSDEKDRNMITFVDNILTLFQQLDGMVVENLFENFVHEVSEYKEIRDFFIVQENNELVHSESYGDQMNACVTNYDKRKEMMEADPRRYPAVNEIIDWTSKWFDTSLPIEVRLIAFAAIEGVIFTSAFVSIYRLKEFNIFPGICKANEWIARDEGMHTSAGIHFFKHICRERNTSVSEDIAHDIIRSATELSCRFARDAVQPHLIGLKLEDLEMYMRLTGNKLATEFGYKEIYPKSQVGCVFEWMSKIGMMNITNFFESRPSEYKGSATESSIPQDLDSIDF